MTSNSISVHSSSAEHGEIHNEKRNTSHVDFQRNHRIKTTSSFEQHSKEKIIRKKHWQEDKIAEVSSSCVNEKTKFDGNKLHHLLLKRNEILQDMEHVRQSAWVRRNSNSSNSNNRILLIDHEERIQSNCTNKNNTQTLDALAELAKKQRWKQHKQSTSPNGVLEFHLQQQRALNDDIMFHAQENTSHEQYSLPLNVHNQSYSSMGMMSAQSSIQEQNEISSLDASLDEIHTMITANDIQEECIECPIVLDGCSNSCSSLGTVSKCSTTNENIQQSPLTRSSDRTHDRHVDYLEQLCTLCNPSSTKSMQDTTSFELQEMDDSFQNLTLLKTWDNDSSGEDEHSYISALTYDDNCKGSYLVGNTIMKKVGLLIIVLIFCISCDWNVYFTKCSKMGIPTVQIVLDPFKTLHGSILAFYLTLKDMCIDIHQRKSDMFDVNTPTHEYIIRSYYETQGYHSGINYKFIHKVSNSLEDELVPYRYLVSDANQAYFQREVSYSCNPVVLPVTNSIESSFQREMYTCLEDSLSKNDMPYHQVTPRLLCLRKADFGFQKFRVLYQKDLVSVSVEKMSYRNELRIYKKWKSQISTIRLKIERRELMDEWNQRWMDSTKVTIFQSEANAFLFRRRVPSFFSFNRMVATTSWQSDLFAIESSTANLVQTNTNECFMGDRRGDSSLPVPSHMNCYQLSSTQEIQKPSVKEYLNSYEEDFTFDLNIGETFMELIKLIGFRKFGTAKTPRRSLM